MHTSTGELRWTNWGGMKTLWTITAKAIEINPANLNAHYNRARTCYYLGRFQEAAEGYSRALKLDPEDAEAFNNRALALDALGELDKAIPDYGAAILVRPGFAEAFNNRGAAQEVLGDYEQALSDYRAAISCEADFIDARYNAARLCWQLGFEDESAIHLAWALELNPDLHNEAAQDDNLKPVLDAIRAGGAGFSS